MTAKVIVVHEAQKDIEEAYAWYENQHAGLGEEFLLCVDACIQQMKRLPESNPIVYKNYRRGLVRRFPYSVFYEYSDNVITIFSVFHSSRDPQKWKERSLK